MKKSNYTALKQFIFDQTLGDSIPPECDNLLHAYIELELQGEDAAAAYPQMKSCFESHPEFRNLYESVRKFMADELNNNLTIPESYTPPEADFIKSLLSANQQKESQKLYLIQWAIKETGNLIVHLRGEAYKKAQELLEGSQHTTAFPQLQVAGPLRGSATQLPQFQLKGAIDDLEIEIKINEIEEEEDLCQVAVQVNIPSRGGWPKLGDTRVALSKKDEEIETQLTDLYGVALFDRVLISDLDYLIFNISPSS